MAKWTDKDERQYEHIKESVLEQGKSEDTAKEVAARTVNKQRREEGRTPNTATDNLSDELGRRTPTQNCIYGTSPRFLRRIRSITLLKACLWYGGVVMAHYVDRVRGPACAGHQRSGLARHSLSIVQQWGCRCSPTRRSGQNGSARTIAQSWKENSD